MANREALQMLTRGMVAWNSWREDHGNQPVDMTGTDLRAFDFHGYRLHGVDFSRCNLTAANFYESVLSGVHFVGVTAPEAKFLFASACQVFFEECDLARADFSRVDFQMVSFQRSNLEEADLIYSHFDGSRFEAVRLNSARLHFALFRNTKLSHVQFDGASFGQTIFAGSDLQDCDGLQAAVHTGPSAIDVATLLSTPLSPEFLRGSGLPDTVLTYLDSLRAAAIDYYSCFLSYSSKDGEFARRLHSDLQAHGVRTWFAPVDLRIGDRFRVRIDESIRVHDKVVLILSASSLASDWVETEVEAALERERRDKRSVLFPIAIDETCFTTDEPWAADIRRKRHLGDFRRWKSHDDYTSSFERLLRDLKRK